MSVPTIIKNIISYFKHNNSSFSKEIGVTSTTIDRYVNGRKESNGTVTYSKPTYDVIREICIKFNVSSDYILGLSDEMFVSDKLILKHLIKNHERLIKNPIFLEYLKTQKLQLDIEKSKKDISDKMKLIEEALLNKLENENNKKS